MSLENVPPCDRSPCASALCNGCHRKTRSCGGGRNNARDRANARPGEGSNRDCSGFVRGFYMMWRAYCGSEHHPLTRRRRSFFVQAAALVQPARTCFAWLSNPTVFLCVIAVALPNALSLGALAFGIGSPPRTAAIMAYATLALVARMVPPLVTVLLYLAIAVYDAISTIALLFNLAPSEIGLALHLSADLKLFTSPLYVTLSIALV